MDEYKPETPIAGTEIVPLLLLPNDEDLPRAVLSTGSRECFFRFPRAFKRPFNGLRRWLFLSRRADDRRLPPFRFECLAKFVRLRI